ncbi:hypothetical protein J1614_005845 [Plenodomus biglobosus]|nr:hypothetical protein J1614_005845 [Plenodomus biglobosus]
MLSNILSLALFASVATAGATLNHRDNKHNPSNWRSKDVIYKDVAIIGGGSSGTYAAISLKDKNVSSIVVEIKDHLGGHTHTYTDQKTGVPIDYGVVIFHTADIVKKYFGRFNIPLVTINPADAVSAAYNYKSGQQIPAPPPSVATLTDAFTKYALLISQWPELTGGMFLPDPVPEVLAQPLGEVAKQYGFEAALPTMASFNPGLGDPLTIPLVEAIRVFNFDLLLTLQAGFLQTAARNNSMLYTAAAAELAASNSLLLSSCVEDTRRNANNVTLVVKTPQGEKLIVAKKLLITIPAKPEYLRPFDITKREYKVFSKFLNGAYYTSIVKNSGLPSNRTIINGDETAPFGFPAQPAVVLGQFSGSPELHTVYYSGPRTSKSTPYSDAFVKKEIITGLKKLQQANPQTFPATNPEFVRFNSHTPFYLQASSEEIKRGFYKELYGLQGFRNAFFTGASWKGQDSTGLWKYTEDVVIPQLIASLRA